MSPLAKLILAHAKSLPEGGLLSPKEFLHLGSRAAIDQTLTRLSREGQILRIARGLYALPIQGKYGERPPSIESIVSAFAKNGEIIVANGAQEANSLGLTTQVPTREIYLSSGPTRVLHLGKRAVEIQHASYWQLILGNEPSGMAIRALSWLGPEQASLRIVKLKKTLSKTQWSKLNANRKLMPSWMAQLIAEASRLA
jgi:hypothetical protein